VPLSVSRKISNVSKGVSVGMRNQNVLRMLEKPFNDSHDLLPRLSFSKYNLRKALAGGARMIDTRETDVFVLEILDAFRGLRSLQISTFMRG